MNELEPGRAQGEKKEVYYGWIVVAGVFFMVAVSCGSFYSFGVFFVPIMEEFGWTRGVISGVLFVSGITYAVAVPLIGSIADRFGYKWISIVTAGLMGLGFVLGSRVQTVWQMYLFIGFLQGIGACAAIPLPLSLITNWFVRRQGLALGIASAGIGTGAATLPLMVTSIEIQFGWRTAMFVVGVLILLIYIPIALFVIRLPESDYVAAHEGTPQTDTNHISDSDNRDISLFQALKTSQFWALFGIFGFCILCLGLIITHLVPYARDTGVSPMSAASLLTTMGLCSIAGRLTAGFLSDRIGAIRVIFCGLFLQGVMILWLSRISSLGMLYFFAFLFGIAYGGNLVMIPRLTASIFGVKSMGAIFGGLSVGDGLGYAIGPLFAGYIFDVTGS
ncbi:MAG: MFS transporter, partial [Desulfobacterales bacterium]|nr:MFS transporter [Desulfobacterales bacterium]